MLNRTTTRWNRTIDCKLSSIVLVSAAAILVSGCTTASPPANSWLNKDQAVAESNAMQRKGLFPVSINCTMEGSKGKRRPIYWMRIKYDKNTNKKEWRWGVGQSDEMNVYENDAKREKLRLIMRKQVSDVTTGQRASCALWHS